jgi:hypothetical protein
MYTCYQLNQPDVSAEVFDSEVLAINLTTGHYHSLRESAVILWDLLMEGHSPDAVAQALAAKHPDAGPVVVEDAHAFISELAAASLIVETSCDGSPPPLPDLPPSPEGTYAKPVIESYTDMQELLLIDPIHEVDVHAGWPQKTPS